jgi:hypothetical protein
MVSFFVMLIFAPMLLWATRIFMSPSPHADERAQTTGIIRILLAVAILGGLFAQLYFLAHNVPSNSRRFYLLALLVIEGIPMLVIICYRDYRNRGGNGAKYGNRTPDREAPTIGNQGIKMSLNTDGMLHVVIGPVRTPRTYRFAILVIVTGLVILLGFQFLLGNPNRHIYSSNTSVEVIRLCQMASGLAVAYILAIIFTEKETVILGPDRLEIERRLLNISVSKRSFPNQEIENLRFAHWRIESRQMPIEQSGIRFDTGSGTHTIGKLVSEAQANELIERMRAIYAFPFERHKQV